MNSKEETRIVVTMLVTLTAWSLYSTAFFLSSGRLGDITAYVAVTCALVYAAKVKITHGGPR